MLAVVVMILVELQPTDQKDFQTFVYTYRAYSNLTHRGKWTVVVNERRNGALTQTVGTPGYSLFLRMVRRYADARVRCGWHWWDGLREAVVVEKVAVWGGRGGSEFAATWVWVNIACNHILSICKQQQHTGLPQWLLFCFSFFSGFCPSIRYSLAWDLNCFSIQPNTIHSY